MLYLTLFLVRYLPFWAVPFGIILFEVGLYYYNRRDRIPFTTAFGLSGTLIILSILWLIFEGYWRAGPWVRRFFDYY